MRIFLLLLLTGLISPCLAASRDLTLFEANAYHLSTAVAVLALQQAAPKAQKQLDTVIARGNQLLQSKQWPLIAQQWQESLAFIAEKRDIAAAGSEAGFPNELLVVQGKLYAAIEQRSASASDRNDASTRDMALLTLEMITAEYMLFNINIFGGHAVIEASIEHNVALFRDELAALKAQDSDLGKDLMRRWTFVEGTILDYNNRSAPFIVLRTADGLRAKIANSLD